MRIRQLLQQKQAILIGLSILSGLFVTYEEIIDCIDLARYEGIEPGPASLFLLLFQVSFFILYTWILLKINVSWCPKTKGHLKQFAYSLFTAGLFALIVWHGVSPIVHERNHEIWKKFEKVADKHDLDRRPGPPSRERDRKSSQFNLRNKIYSQLYHDQEEDWHGRLFILFIIIYTLSRIYHLYQQKEEAERNFEKLQSESLQSQLDALQNQINPHFFFNALNSLHALIAEGENQKSIAYLSNLSNVFRYILQSEKKGMVTLQEELNFLEMYRFMLYVKYEERLRFDMDIAPECMSYELPVLSLLPLVENVIKHNEISVRHPMTLSIRSTDEPSLVIQNPKQPKLDEVDKVGIGLKNLDNRFLLLSNKEIRIEDTTDYFRVTLPLRTPVKPIRS